MPLFLSSDPLPLLIINILIFIWRFTFITTMLHLEPNMILVLFCCKRAIALSRPSPRLISTAVFTLSVIFTPYFPRNSTALHHSTPL